MEVLEVLCSELRDRLFSVTDDKIKQDIIFQHISKAELENFVFPDFPLGLDWFNVSQALDYSMLEGKLMVVDFFTYCCINCLHIIPYLRRLEEKYSIKNGLIVIGIHSAKFENEKHSEKILLALNRYNIKHPVVNDKTCILWNKLKISCWPTILIVGPNKKIIFAIIGEGHQDELFLFVENSLKYYNSLISSHLLPSIYSNKIITSSILSYPSKIARWQNMFAVSDTGNHRILIFDDNGNIKFVIGGKTSGFNDGNFEQAKFSSPQGLIFYNSNTLYIADTENHAIRQVCLEKLIVTTIIGNGHQGTDYVGGKIGIHQEISSPWDICIVPCPESTLSKSFLSEPKLKETAAISVPSSSNDSHSSSRPTIKNDCSFAPPPPPLPNVLSNSSFVPAPPPLPKQTSSIISNVIHDKNIIKYGENINKIIPQVLLIATAGTHQIWAYFIEEGTWWQGKKYSKNICLAVAGSGKEENRNNCYPNLASFAQPSGLSYSKELYAVFIADSESSTIRKLSLKDGSVSHVIGGSKTPDDLFSYGDVDGVGYKVKLQHPLAVVWNSKNESLYICDTYNHRIKICNPITKTCVSVSGGSNLFNEPSGCCLSHCENFLYICDTNNNEIKTVDLNNNEVKKFLLKEKPSSIPGADCALLKSDWKLETILSKDKSSLKLEIEFYPIEIHGKWKIVLEKGNLNVDTLKGNITTNELTLNMVFPPSKNDNDEEIVFRIYFNLVLCEKEKCNLKKIVLEVFIRRENDAEIAKHCKLHKSFI